MKLHSITLTDEELVLVRNAVSTELVRCREVDKNRLLSDTGKRNLRTLAALNDTFKTMVRLS